MAQYSEWLQVMLGEISRQREDAERAREEQQRREQEEAAANAPAARPLNDSSAARR
jgi:hypothetical protein